MSSGREAMTSAFFCFPPPFWGDVQRGSEGCWKRPGTKELNLRARLSETPLASGRHHKERLCLVVKPKGKVGNGGHVLAVQMGQVCKFGGTP